MEQGPANSQKDTDKPPGPPDREKADKCKNVSKRRVPAKGDEGLWKSRQSHILQESGPAQPIPAQAKEVL